MITAAFGLLAFGLVLSGFLVLSLEPFFLVVLGVLFFAGLAVLPVTGSFVDGLVVAGAGLVELVLVEEGDGEDEVEAVTDAVFDE